MAYQRKFLRLAQDTNCRLIGTISSSRDYRIVRDPYHDRFSIIATFALNTFIAKRQRSLVNKVTRRILLGSCWRSPTGVWHGTSRESSGHRRCSLLCERVKQVYVPPCSSFIDPFWCKSDARAFLPKMCLYSQVPLFLCSRYRITKIRRLMNK